MPMESTINHAASLMVRTHDWLARLSMVGGGLGEDALRERRRIVEAHELVRLAVTREESRQRAIRAVVAAQWGVAIAALAHECGENKSDPLGLDEWDNAYENVNEHIADLPCAVDLIGGEAHCVPTGSCLR